jgi:hypothetical protein
MTTELKILRVTLREQARAGLTGERQWYREDEVLAARAARDDLSSPTGAGEYTLTAARGPALVVERLWRAVQEVES